METRRTIITGALAATALPAAAIAASIAVDPIDAIIAATVAPYKQYRLALDRCERLRAELAEADAELESRCRDATDALHEVETATPTTYKGHVDVWKFLAANELGAEYDSDVLIRLGNSLAKLV